jgi:molybdopterin converting factor subunit 1
MNIRIQYYALLREQAGTTQESVDTNATSGRELYQELQKRHGFTLDVSQCRIAINGAFADMDSALSEHCEVVFIPPVAGG